MTDRWTTARERAASARSSPELSAESPERTIEPGFVGRTFDDFLFRPRQGVVDSRRAVTLGCRLTSGISLELPVVSANMDSVTGGAMAQGLALEGGIGFIHRGMSIDAQAREVALVKRSHGFVVEEPRRIHRK